jgi:hypothetical protein
MQKMKHNKQGAGSRRPRRGAFGALGAIALAAMLAACGGGDSGPRVQSVVAAPLLEGDAGTQNLELTVTLDTAPTKDVWLSYTTLALGKAGVAGSPAGFATGGVTCATGVDFVQARNMTAPILKGETVATLQLPVVCGDTVFEPNEVFQLNWSMGASEGTLTVTLINDDAGGLNSPGVSAVLGGATAFGRDTHALTNAAADGALGFSFADTASGACRHDRVTGLTWAPVDDTRVTYAAAGDAVGLANGIALCGFSDWRLPGAEELASLVDHSRMALPLHADATAGSTQMTGRYWSQDRHAAASVDQMVVSFTDVGAVGGALRTGTAGVRLVRGAALGDACGGGRFVNHGDGTLSDAKTGLMWKQCPEGLSGVDCATGSAWSTTETGNLDAVGHLAAVNAEPTARGLGYGDWRIPSRHELASLLCRGPASAPLIDSVAFPATGAYSYLSSTLHAAIPSASWFVNFDTDGAVGATSNPGKRVRLVRAGQ